MKQKDFVIEAMRKNGGMATFSQLNKMVDVSLWGTKTPFASIRSIVQRNDEFFKLQPGLWGLSEFKNKLLNLNIDKTDNEFSHSYFQGLIAEIGNARKFDTYIPAQDKNKIFINQKLSNVASIEKIYDFTYPNIIRYAKTIDVVWFNERKLPNAFFEVEHSTDFKNSLGKFYELQDFRVKFFIVAQKEKRRRYDDIISASIYKDLRDFVKFIDYESIVRLHEKEMIRYEI
ncbi:hypothetical protein LMG7974_01866 [Campylobacter majalis]|uniref:HTH HARE-type domain-containing protein n=1 Tax=Campylobacter majalis TaxID=2790656 RepID=A0ABN7KCJ9_9BACT|nr:hypothetical protein [Campylobacter majalis]CAD7289783.1 hypothetical protein LMG7974_01866 [Campylobacter majalis]